MVILRFEPLRNTLKRDTFDAAYLDRLGRGDPETEGHFTAYFGELVLIKVRARGGSPVFAEDVRQETFLRVLRTLRGPGGLRDPGALGAFVNSVCNRVLLELGRSERRHRVPSEEPEPGADPSTPSPEALLVTEERKAAVRRVIDGLPPRDRDLLRGFFLEERDKAELCQKMGVSRDYFRVLLHRAKNQFRTVYLEREGVPPASADERPPARQSVG